MSKTKPITIKVWDVPVRLFHWSLVVLVAVSWYTGEEGMMDWHMYSGYSILALVLFRLMWGLVGSTTARFAHFLAGPGRTLAYVRDLAAGRHRASIGHNPMGGWSIVAMLGAVSVQAGSGLFANDDIFTEGPLAPMVSKATSDWLTGIHELTFNILLGLIALHLAAIVYYTLAKREDLVRPMVTGAKRVAEDAPSGGLRFVSPLAAAPLAAVAAIAVWLLVA